MCNNHKHAVTYELIKEDEENFTIGVKKEYAIYEFCVNKL